MQIAGIVTGGAANDNNATDSRELGDRRQMSWRTVAWGFFRSRRRAFRRGDEARAVYSDWHHPWIFFLGVSIMLMSVTDAFLTLQLIGAGAVEVNPVMRELIEQDTTLFVSIKLAMTALGLFVLVYASRFRMFGKLRVGIIITTFFCAYLTLIAYELIGIMQLFGPS